MIKDNEKEHLLKLVLHQKLYFSEIEEKLTRVTYSLMADNVYTIDRAIPDLLKLIISLSLNIKLLCSKLIVYWNYLIKYSPYL